MALGSRIGWYLLIAASLAAAQVATTANSAGTAPDAITITAAGVNYYRTPGVPWQ